MLSKARSSGSRRKSKTHPVLYWFRTIGVGGQFTGWGTLLYADHFWYGVAFIYLGFLALVIDPWFETKLQGKTFWRIGISALIVAFALIFSFSIVFTDYQLGTTISQTLGVYPTGTVINGIEWKPEYTELRIWITNNSNVDYEDLDILVRPSNPIVHAAQASSIPGVSLVDADNASIRMTQGKSAIPLDLLATDAGYRIGCPKLAPNTTIEIVMAIADIRYASSPGMPVTDSNYVIKTRNPGDFSTYWYGHPNGNVYASTGGSVEWVVIKGSYMAMHRKRQISESRETE